ncbi:hypothetical protein GCM10007291_45210 [Gemmobacter nanjingensis]|uniref:Integrase DNA-binding domain-containing protein n=2 Tax=Gemmobacter nanjingensis TaxID=488454 RepID=A0ABQ3FSC7_9RHOB|nr:hypothetical protein GCM10007291_45210 [Gemmobacter nanjingensis]
MRYRFEGKEKMLSFGAYPDVKLADARALRDKAKRALAEGRDPGANAKAALTGPCRGYVRSRGAGMDQGSVGNVVARPQRPHLVTL